ncbi:MAG: putative rRNA maturation factor [Planctomycetaceae bacterium]|jgi:probable rRNA maturation factor
MYEIEIADNQECLTIDEELVRTIVRQTLQTEQVSSATISVAIVDNAQIHELNRQYLNHDFETDVLSFLLDESRDETAKLPSDAPRGAGKIIDGEVIVSTEMASAIAADYSWDVLDELTLYIVHGLLHLCGYDDLTAEELPIMRARECHVFEALGRPKPSRDSSDHGHVDEAQRSSEEQIAAQSGGLS